MNDYHKIPKMDILLGTKNIQKLLDIHPRTVVLDSLRQTLENIREDIKEGLSGRALDQAIAQIPDQTTEIIKKKLQLSLKAVINGSGVIIHTNLGRSVLPASIMAQLSHLNTQYSNLEYDIRNGKRGSRYSHLAEIIIKITGGEAAMVVNNNAAAVMLILSTLAKGREVLVSRGELIEIGGSFRIPDICQASGSRLVEVGTTNKTHLYDYERNITENTAAIFKVHTSNYRILGFTESVSSADLLKLKQKYYLPIIEDLGSGVLIDLEKYGLEHEPTVQDSIRNGVDVVCFSGDKLLGGPQAGIIVGKQEYIDAMKKNPLTRAFRVDKLTIGILDILFHYYLDDAYAVDHIPTLSMLTMSDEELKKRAVTLLDAVQPLSDDYQFSIEPVCSEVGGGSMPLLKLPSYALAIASHRLTATEFEKHLRRMDPPIIARIQKDIILLDVRTILLEQYGKIVASLATIVRKVPNHS